ncbi:hypothetical protein E4T66_17220 [Sinimarinibacterium sp. CAU 1509]|uniref:DUF7167 family protein n=1 Tax=Sinimarinibacterium sp. CAU 1509 TaxID=2562283 RepID=UPI0010AD675B|nr:hypothetical protein [Sinimarinibacterium sp. CAU 1509]TJY57152.1 hypothetical protein E4T66_17220 [Sinimarinibacterium sp. CAU 1509]
MAKKFKIWLDSGANAHSCSYRVISLDDIGLSDDAWDAMSEDEQEDRMKEVAWERMEWGFEEVDSDEDEGG